MELLQFCTKPSTWWLLSHLISLCLYLFISHLHRHQCAFSQRWINRYCCLGISICVAITSPPLKQHLSARARCKQCSEESSNFNRLVVLAGVWYCSGLFHLLHKSHSALDKYPTMHHFGALWGFWNNFFAVFIDRSWPSSWYIGLRVSTENVNNEVWEFIRKFNPWRPRHVITFPYWD